MKITRLAIIIMLIVVVCAWAQTKKESSEKPLVSTKEEQKQEPEDVIFSFGPEDVDLLIDLTYSDNYKIAQKAVYRLGQLKLKKAFDRLISIFLFSGSSVEKGFDEVILASIWALGELGDKRALEPLVDNYDRFKSIPYRIEIIRAIGKLGKGSEKAFIFLDRVIKSVDNNMIAFETVRALKNVDKPEVIKTFSEVLKSGRFERWVNKEIEKALSEMGTSQEEEKKGK
ncbi:MAG: hypothetical protein ABDH28_05490 [Brevinematia bacterium]